jgi:integrase
VKVRQRKGKWWVLIDHKGKRKAKCTGDSQRTARLFAEKMEAALILGQFDLKKKEQHKRPFDAYFRTWLDTYVKAHCKERTYDLYMVSFRRYLLPRFGQKDIGAILREDVKKFVYELLAQARVGVR